MWTDDDLSQAAFFKLLCFRGTLGPVQTTPTIVLEGKRIQFLKKLFSQLQKDEAINQELFRVCFAKLLMVKKAQEFEEEKKHFNQISGRLQQVQSTEQPPAPTDLNIQRIRRSILIKTKEQTEQEIERQKSVTLFLIHQNSSTNFNSLPRLKVIFQKHLKNVSDLDARKAFESLRGFHPSKHSSLQELEKSVLDQASRRKSGMLRTNLFLQNNLQQILFQKIDQAKT